MSKDKSKKENAEKEQIKRNLATGERAMTKGVMAGNYVSNPIRIAPERVEEAITSLGNLKQRLRELEIDKERLSEDSGCVSEELQIYDRTLTMIIAQLKTLIDFTTEVLQKTNNTFVETDRKIAGRIG